jgi:hypothetical protein
MVTGEDIKYTSGLWDDGKEAKPQINGCVPKFVLVTQLAYRRNGYFTYQQI